MLDVNGIRFCWPKLGQCLGHVGSKMLESQLLGISTSHLNISEGCLRYFSGFHCFCKFSTSALRERHVWNKRWAACVSTAHQSATYEKKRLAFVLVLVSRVESYGKHISSIWADIQQRQLWFVCINTADSNKKASEVFSQIAHPDPIDTLRVKKRFSDFRKERKAKLVGHIMRADTPDALRAETVQSDSVSRVGYGTRKVSPD